MKRIVIVFLISIIIVDSSPLWAWGKKSTSKTPATVSESTKKAEEKAEAAKKSAESAINHVDNAKENLSSAKAESEVRKAKSDSAKATKAAKEAEKKAAEAALQAAKAGTEEAQAAKERAEKAAKEATEAALEAKLAADEVEKALSALYSRQEEYDSALRANEEAKRKLEEEMAALAEAKAADDNFQQAWEQYKQLEKELSEAVNELSIGKKKISEEEYDSIINDFLQKEDSAMEAYRTAEMKMEAAIDAYGKLGDFYDAYCYSGDPVNIGSGDFILKYEDYVAQDYLDKFIITRNLSASGLEESFGYNWTCSLDTRIIRCNFKDYENDKQLIEKSLLITQNMRSLFELYNKNYPKHPRDEVKEFFENADSINESMKKELENVKKIIEIRNSILEKNKFCTYGAYANPKSYEGYSKQLILVDEEGRGKFFEYENNGKWVSSGEINKKELEIYNLNEAGDISYTEDCSGGYKLCFDTGKRYFYNQYGILEKKVDENENVTTYKNNNGRINEVLLKTGEVIYIERDNHGFITGITGKTSGTAFYSYENNFLKEVILNDGKTYKYNYLNGRLCDIKSSENTGIHIEYEFNEQAGKYVCSSVTNKKGFTEQFYYDFENKFFLHKTVDGKTEEYKLNEGGNPEYIKDSYGNETHIETNNKGLINSVIQNGIKKTFFYDGNYRPIEVHHENEGIVTLEYGENSKVQKIKDADGYAKYFTYDNKGNLEAEYLNNVQLCKYEYYPSGLLKTIVKDEETVTFEYNNFGSVIRKIEKLKNGKILSIEKSYDGKNRLISFKDVDGNTTFFFYAENKKTIKNDNYQLEYFYDSGNRLIKLISKDLVTGQTDLQEWIYDKNENLIRSLINGVLYEEREYDENNSIINKTLWDYPNPYLTEEKFSPQGIKDEYQYNLQGYITEVCKYPVNQKKESTKKKLLLDERISNTISYSSNTQETSVSVKNVLDMVSTSKYDNYGRLKEEKFPNGYTRKTFYTKAGRIAYKTDSEFWMWEYKYKNDGSWDILVTLKSMPVAQCSYDYFGRLIIYKDDIQGTVRFKYDRDKLIEEKAPEYLRKCEYDVLGRKCYYSENNKYGIPSLEYKIKYDDKNHNVSIYAGNNTDYFSKYSLDGFGRVVQIINDKGKTFYEYDYLGRVVKKTDGNNSVFLYAYDSNNISCYVLYPDGQERFITHNVNGDVIEIEENNHILKKTEFNQENKSIVFTDCFGNRSGVYYDKTGNIYREEMNRAGVLEYSKLKEDKLYKDSGTVFEIQRDASGKITKLKSDSTWMEFSYDLRGNIISFEDILKDSKIKYSYDQFGRGISKNINGEIINYEYDSCGNVKRISDAGENYSVYFQYDVYGRETGRQYWNGMKEITSYNDYGLIEAKLSYDSIGQLINCNFLLYDENGRLSYDFNKEGEFKNYTYNSKGQLEKVVYPYNQKMYEFNLSEAKDCGLPIEEAPKLFSAEINDEARKQVKNLISNYRLENMIIPESIQSSWIEEYSYTSGGSVASVKNNIGILRFKYDNLNRPIEKYYDGFSDRSMKITWDENGNLKQIQGEYSVLELTHETNNRIKNIKYLNKDTLTAEEINYEYDALGRRTYENYGKGKSYSVLYDGLTSNVLQRLPVYENKLSAIKDSLYSATDVNQKWTYRYIEDESYKPYEGEKYYFFEKNNELELSKTYDLQLSLCVNGGNVITKNNYSIEPVISDYKRKALNYRNDYTSSFDCYDVYGNNYNEKYSLLGNISEIGGRDYLPLLKCFTSEDPERDGVNWYAYCSGDPVNYTDVDGYTIIPVPQLYLMTDKSFANINTGNSSSNDDSINKVGCYVVSYANAVSELFVRGLVNTDKYSHSTVYGINNDKSYFSKEKGHEADIIRKDSMDKIFNSSTENAQVSWDYFTTEVSGDMRIKIELAKANALKDECVVMGVFDLSEKYEKVPNHMVILNDMFDENEVFKDITYSSKNDEIRQKENPDVYCVDNLKEIRIVKAERKDCCK